MNTNIYRAQKPLDNCSVTVKQTADGSYIWELRSTKRFETAAQAFYDAMLSQPNVEEKKPRRDSQVDYETMLDIVRACKGGEQDD